MIEPTERVLWLLVAIATVGAVGISVPAVGDSAAVLLAVLGIALVADTVGARSPRALTVWRELPPRALVGQPTPIAVNVRSAARVRVEIVDTPPPGSQAPATLDTAPMRHAVALSPGQTAHMVAARVFTTRGTLRFGRLAVRTLGPLGLVRRRARIVTDDTLTVLPDVARIAARAVRLARGDPSAGARRRVPREGREFEALREYVAGDDARMVAWKQSARRGTLVVKKTRPEQRQDVVLLLDAGRLLCGAHEPADGGEARFDHAVNTALTLAAAALDGADRTGLVAFGGDVRAAVPAGPGLAQLRQMAIALTGVDAVPEEADYAAAMRFVLAQQKRRALVCIFTDVVDELSVRALCAALALLRGRHKAIVIALADPALARLARADAPQVDDVERAISAAAARMLARRRQGLKALEAIGATVVDAPAPRAAALAVEAYLHAKARGEA